MRFYAKIGSDARIHIPNKFESTVKENDLAKIVLNINGKSYEGFARISVCRRKHRKPEYLAIPRNYSIPKNVNSKVYMSILSRLHKNRNLGNFYISNIFDLCGRLDNKSVVTLYGNSLPLITGYKFSPEELAFYMGCYFSDGTKKSTYWRINASTFEQANYYIKMHKTLVKRSSLQFRLTFSGKKTDAILAARKWRQKCGIVIPNNRIKVIPISGTPLKWNKYGSLNIYENGLGILLLYIRLMESILKNIENKKRKDLAIEFLCGILEGDGTVNAKKRGHIQIATNREDVKIIEKLLQTSGLNYKSVVENGQKYYLRIGALEILRNFDCLKNKVFIFYPKRRAALFSRLATVGAVKYLTSNHSSTSWVKAWLKTNGLVDNKYTITRKGTKLRNDFIMHMKSAKDLWVK